MPEKDSYTVHAWRWKETNAALWLVNSRIVRCQSTAGLHATIKSEDELVPPHRCIKNVENIRHTDRKYYCENRATVSHSHKHWIVDGTRVRPNNFAILNIVHSILKKKTTETVISGNASPNFHLWLLNRSSNMSWIFKRRIQSNQLSLHINFLRGMGTIFTNTFRLQIVKI